MLTTKELKDIIEREGKITLIVPKHLSGNPMDLEVEIHKLKDKLMLEPDIFVNGVHQRKLPFDSELYKAWFKSKKDKNDWYNKFNEDFRFLANLNIPPIDPNYNILGGLLKENYKKNTSNTKGLNKTKNINNIEKTFYVEDLVTKEIRPVSFSELEDLKGLEHIKVLTKKAKQKYRIYKKSLAPIECTIIEKPPSYWKKSQDNDRIFIPREPKQTGKVGTFKVVNKKLINIHKEKKKKLQTGLPNRYKRLQVIRMRIPEKSVTLPVHVPEYKYEKISDNFYKKIFVKLNTVDVTFERPERIINKTIVVSVYPPAIMKKRSIVKKNYKLLKEQHEKNKQEQIKQD